MLPQLIALCLASTLIPSGAIMYNAADSMIKENHYQAVNPQNSDPLEDLMVVDEFKNKYLFGAYLSDPLVDNFDVIATLEYGYTIDGAYNLYLYVFNQSGTDAEYNFSYSGNRIEIFNEVSGSYEHAPIKYVAISSDKKFIKYRLDVFEQDYTRVDGARQYGIVGIEIASIKNSQNLTWQLHDYEVGHSWVWTGFESTLQVDYASDFDYLSLDVNVGCYQTGSSSYSPTAKNNLFYAYFAVPQTFAGEEYSLYSVHADYYDFNLSNKIAVVTDKHSQSFYQDLYDLYLADGILDSTEREDISFYYDNENGVNNFLARYFFFETYDGGQPLNSENKHFWWMDSNEINARRIYTVGSPVEGSSYYNADYNPYFFNVDAVDDIVPFSVVDSILDLDTVESLSGQNREDVYQEIHYTSDKNPINDATYVDWDLLSYGDTHNDWENWWAQNIQGTVTSELSLKDIPCIEKVGADVLTSLDIDNQNKYLVDPEELLNLKAYYSANSLILKNTYLFRFNSNVYDSKQMSWSTDNGDSVGFSNLAGYMVNKYNVAIDFDIIDLTFINDYEELLQIPVVADPHNVGSDLTPPPSGYDWSWLIKLIVTILGIILIIWLFSKIMPFFNTLATANNGRQIKSLRKDVKNSKKSSKSSKTRRK